jgi:aminopeptidase N
MLKAQSVKAPKMIDRYDAIFAMRSFAVEQKRSTLMDAFTKNAFHAIRAEIVMQLIDDKSIESINLIKAALIDNDPQVRKSVILNVKTIEPSLIADYEKLLLDSSYITIAAALEKLCFQFPDNTVSYLDKTKDIEGTNGRNVKIKWLEIAVSTGNNEKKYIDQLVGYTSNSFEFITRANAMAALRKLNYFDEACLLNCLQACLSNNGRLSGPANETVKYFFNQAKHKKMIVETIASKKLQGWEKDVLNRLIH